MYQREPLRGRPALLVLVGLGLALGALVGCTTTITGRASTPAAPAGNHADQVAGMSFVVPPGFELAAPEEKLVYGTSSVSRGRKEIVLLGKLDGSLFAASAATTLAAAKQLASGLGEFFIPTSGTEVDKQTGEVGAPGLPGSTAYYEVVTDGGASAGMIFTAVVQSGDDRWWLAWLDQTGDPLDKAAALDLARSIVPL